MTKRFELNEDLTCPELAGYRLPEWKPEIYVEQLAKQTRDEINKTAYCCQGEQEEDLFDVGFISGYKAREKYEFTESDMRKAVEMARERINHPDYDYVYENEIEIIQSLRTRRPVAIEVEMEESPAYNAIRMIDNSGCFVYCKPATNPDGTLKATYIFED